MQGVTATFFQNMFGHLRIIAKGKRIRDLPRLPETYGGRASEWTKKSSSSFQLAGITYEYH